MARMNHWLALAAAGNLAGIPLLTLAADQPNPPTTDQLSVVVITATKRQTTVQDTPASITAVTAADIANRGLTDFNSLAQSVPGMAMRSSGPGQTEFEMRGLDSSGGNTSMVGLYIDDIPLSSPASAQLGKIEIDPDLYDLSRVEVLHGPQGTLYGASSMGGTVRLVTNAPQLNSMSATAETVVSDTASGGSINHEESGMLNLPLGTTAAVRVVGSLSQDSGWIKRLVIQDGAVAVDSGVFPAVSRPSNFYTAPLQEALGGVNTTDVSTVRAQLLWKPMENLSISPIAMYQLTQQGAPNTVDVNGDPTNPQVPAVNAHWEIYDVSEPQSDSFTLGGLETVYRLPAFSVTSVTGYWNRDTLVSQDASEENAAAIGIPVYDPPGGIGVTGPAPDGPGVTERDYTRQTSEELRATSTTSGPLQWLVGYFYQDLLSEWNTDAIVPGAAPFVGGSAFYVDYEPQVITQNAQFGELTWRFNHHLKVTAGLRHYHFSLAQDNSEYGAFTVNAFEGNTVPYDTTASNRASGTVPMFNVTYDIDQDYMVYATASKGFRLGGVNQPIPVASTLNGNSVLAGNECGLQAKLLNNGCNIGAGNFGNPALLLQAPADFGSDSVWNYELGEKSAFLQRRMTFDLTGYHELWLHPQLATNLAGFGITANGADASINGVEGELRALIVQDWHALVNFGYTSAKFNDSSVITGYPSGMEVTDIPKVTASAVLEWEHGVTSNLSLFGNLEGDFVGSRTTAPYGETITLANVNQYLVHLSSYNLLNVRFGVVGERWTVALFVNNLTNKEVLLDPQPQVDLQSQAYVRYSVNQPLTAGIDLNYQFQ